MARSSATLRVALDALGLFSRRASSGSCSLQSATANSCRSVTNSSASCSMPFAIDSMPFAARVPRRPFFARSLASIEGSSSQSLLAVQKTKETEAHDFAIGRRGIASTSRSSSTSSTGNEEPLPDEATFHAAADKELHDLVDVLEPWVDEVLSDKADVEYSSGVLTLRLGDCHGTYVINKQAPNRQLWLSSPVSGPFRYDLVKSDTPSPSWIYRRDGHEMRERLREEFRRMYGEGGPDGL